ncbi:MAG: hypothetical protein EAZ61_06915 [Oscillatoriales cyanobacterium]|nr:MAG: hypothetical protein EAZ61_06915 [Oscillatoriales cyanobacterium]
MVNASRKIKGLSDFCIGSNRLEGERSIAQNSQTDRARLSPLSAPSALQMAQGSGLVAGSTAISDRLFRSVRSHPAYITIAVNPDRQNERQTLLKIKFCKHKFTFSCQNVAW